jgi:hypothetical protein
MITGIFDFDIDALASKVNRVKEFNPIRSGGLVGDDKGLISNMRWMCYEGFPDTR